MMQPRFEQIGVSLLGVSLLRVLLALLLAVSTTHADDASAQFFDDQIAPLLAQRCAGCHNGSDLKGQLDLTRQETALAGGESGPILAAGEPDHSLLWNKVASGEMPPGKPLPAAELALLKDWITSGAKWGTNPIDLFRFTTATRAGRNWWSLQPLGTGFALRSEGLKATTAAEISPTLPKLSGTSAQSSLSIEPVRNAIDIFIRERLQAEGLVPSPLADKRTLIRRLSFDLLGLPPTPEEVDAFLSDEAPDA